MSDPAAADVAVVIVNFNTGAWLERCLALAGAPPGGGRGRRAGDRQRLERRFAPGGGRGARPTCGSIENPTNRYLSPAWNQGARETKAPYLLFLNPDTEWWRGTLEEYRAIAAAAPIAGIVGPAIRNADGTLYPSGRRFPSVVGGSRARVPVAVHAEQRGSRAATSWTGGIARRPGTVDWVSRRVHVDAPRRLRRDRRLRRGLPAVCGGARHRHAAVRRPAGRFATRRRSRSCTQVGVSTMPDGRRPHRLVVMHAGASTATTGSIAHADGGGSPSPPPGRRSASRPRSCGRGEAIRR